MSNRAMSATNDSYKMGMMPWMNKNTQFRQRIMAQITYVLTKQHMKKEGLMVFAGI